MKHPDHDRPGERLRTVLSRRAFLGTGAAAVGGLGLQTLLGRTLFAQEAGAGLAAGVVAPHHPVRAKHVILIFLNGGASNLDLFHEKPLLGQRRGEEIPPSVRGGPKSELTAINERDGTLAAVGSMWDFKTYGKSERRFSELVPHIGAVADELTVIRSLQTDFVLHESAISVLLTGTQLLGRPSWGSWISYALGRIDEDLPRFCVLNSSGAFDTPLQPRLWHSGFLPGEHQGVQLRSGSAPVLDVKSPPGVSKAARGAVLDAVKKLNELEAEASGDPDVSARIRAYEMAARMQASVPELADLSDEPPEVLEAYGADPKKPSFSRNALLARRLVERGVRFVQLQDGGWDHHSGIPRSLPRKAEDIDRGTGALIADLKQRGLLDDTLVILTGEFGRTPYCDGPLGHNRYGRDHHPLANVALLAGGGVRRGLDYGETDEWGWDVVENPMHVHDLQATVLRCLGYDHEKLTFRHQGRDFRLTDVAGRVVEDLLA